MIRYLYDPKCAARLLPQWENDEPAWDKIIVHRAKLKAAPPADHGLSVGPLGGPMEFTPLSAVVCDACNAVIPPGTEAVAVTLVRKGNGEPPRWWLDYME